MDTFNVDDYVETLDYLRSEFSRYSESLSRVSHEIKILQDKQGFLSQKVEELDERIEALKAEYGDPVLPVGYPRYDPSTNTANGRTVEVGVTVSLCRDGSNTVLVSSIVEEAQRHLRGGGTCTFSMPEYSDSVLVSVVYHLRKYLEVHAGDVREDDSILWAEKSKKLERIHTTYVQLGHVLDFILFDIKR